MKTSTPSKAKLNPSWHIVDAKGKVLGRLASDVASILIGKNKATYTPNINVGDKVVVLNSDLFAVTGSKTTSKLYTRHTGFPGGIKQESLRDLTKRQSEKVIRNAVNGMLPKNKLRKERMSNLYVYKGTEHPHQGQVAN